MHMFIAINAFLLPELGYPNHEPHAKQQDLYVYMRPDLFLVHCMVFLVTTCIEPTLGCIWNVINIYTPFM